MRAMVYVGKPELELQEVPIPIPKENEVLLEVLACGVCRTDLHIVDKDIIPPHLPIIPGHQIVGKVTALGKDATKFKLGSYVGVPWLGGCCFHCPFCLRNEENLCDFPVFTGFTRNGGYAEYCTANEEFCFHIPKTYPPEKAAPLLCAGLIGYRALKLCGPVNDIGMVGFGASAHIITQAARHLGKNIFAFTRAGDKNKQDFALRLGAAWSGSIEAPPEKLLDAVIIFASEGALVPQALKLVRKGGVVVCAGIHMSDISAFPYKDLWEERVIRSVANLTRQDGLEFLLLAEKYPLAVETTVYPLDKANQALKDLRNGKFNGSAVICP
ncbi:MAG: zinc-dependent alcohol dehydrogenase family protein [Parachlamydiales bacterium]|jgi:propanol-preferring alcohol dehydrogenase